MYRIMDMGVVLKPGDLSPPGKIIWGISQFHCTLKAFKSTFCLDSKLGGGGGDIFSFFKFFHFFFT